MPNPDSFEPSNAGEGPPTGRRIPEMVQPERDLVGEHFSLEPNPLVDAAMVGMRHDIARGLVDRQFEGRDAIFVDRRGKMTAKSAHEFARSAKFFEIAADLDLGTRDSKLCSSILSATQVRSSISRPDPEKVTVALRMASTNASDRVYRWS